MKNHLGRDDGSKKTLCGQPAGFAITDAKAIEIWSHNLCAKCERIAAVASSDAVPR